MNFVDIPVQALAYISHLKQKKTDIADLLTDIEGALNNRLWNQVSFQILTLFSENRLEAQERIEFYSQLVMSIQNAFNPKKALKIVQITADSHQNPSEALTFLENATREMKLSEKHQHLLDTLRGELLLVKGDKFEAEQLINKISKGLENLSDVDSEIYFQFYHFNALYYDQINDYDNYYKAGMQYLACKEAAQLNDKEVLQIVFKMSYCCLFGDKIFDFAELIEKDYFKKLIDSEYDVFYRLVSAFNQGNTAEFREAIEKCDQANPSNQAILSNRAVLEAKLKIASLLENVFNRNKNDRVLSFKDVVEATGCDLNEVELVVVKTFSLGLMEGFIDEVSETVVVERISPKYLESDKIKVLEERVDKWIQSTTLAIGEFKEMCSPLVN